MSERLSWSEAEAVVRAYRAEHGMASDVDVATLARTLGTSPSEVRRLARLKRRFIDRSGVLSAGLALSVLVVASIAVVPQLRKDPIVAQRPPQTFEGLVITNMKYDPETRTYTPIPANGSESTDPSKDPSSLLSPDDKTL